MSDKERRPGSAKQTMVEQLRQEILDLIAERGLDAGDKLDAESALSKRFGVSRPTVRDALTSREQEVVLNAV
ncbi:GntR family transcriptional regulator, partial [Lacisediminihabitans profunda]